MGSSTKFRKTVGPAWKPTIVMVALAIAGVPVHGGSAASPEVTDASDDTYDVLLGTPDTGNGTSDLDIVAVWLAANSTHLFVSLKIHDLHVPGEFREFRNLHVWEVLFETSSHRFQAVAFRDAVGQTGGLLDMRGTVEAGSPSTTNGKATLLLDPSHNTIIWGVPRTYGVELKGSPENVSFSSGTVIGNISAYAYDGRGSPEGCDFCVELDRTDASSATYVVADQSARGGGVCEVPNRQGFASWAGQMNVASTSRSFTVPVGSNQTMLVLLGEDLQGTQQPAYTVAFGGQPLTMRIAANTGNDRVSLWWLRSPPQGTHALTVSWPTQAHAFALAAAVYNGTDTHTPIGAAGTSTGNGTLHAASIVTQRPGSIMVAGAMQLHKQALLEVASPAVQTFQQPLGNNHGRMAGGELETLEAAQYTIAVTSSVAAAGVGLAAEVQGPPCNPPPPNPPQMFLDPRISRKVAGFYLCVATPPDYALALCW